MIFYGLTMLFSGIALVLDEIIVRISFMEFRHDSVTGDFGNNGGCSNGCGTGFPFDQRLLCGGNGDLKFTVHKEKTRRNVLFCKLKGSTFHGKEGGLQDIDFVYDFMGDNTNTDMGRNFVKIIEKDLTFLWGKFFGVYEKGVVARVRKYNSRSNNGSGQGTPANLVETCNNRVSLLLQAAFEKKIVLLWRIKQRQDLLCILFYVLFFRYFFCTFSAQCRARGYVRPYHVCHEGSRDENDEHVHGL